MTDAETERKAIVAWLRKHRLNFGFSERVFPREFLQGLANSIERGAHLNPETHNEG